MKGFFKGFVFTVVQFAVVIAIALGLSDCGDQGGGHGGPDDGGSGTPGGVATPGDTSGGTPKATAVAGPATATIKGMTKFNGTPPKMPVIPMNADPLCVEVNEGNQVRLEQVVVGENGELENVFIYVKNPPPGDYKAPSEPVVLDQNGCIYRPHILGVMVGQDIEVRNSDKSNHNINVLSKIRQGFNVNQGPGQAPIIKNLRRPEMAIDVKCNVHPWMNAKMFSMEHPFFGVARQGGAFEISEKLPAGTYTVVAWHERFGEKTQDVTLAEGETKEVTFQFP